MPSRLHCVPVNDLDIHMGNIECWCHPTETDPGLHVHNAKDCREVAERRNGDRYCHNWTIIREDFK